MARNDTVILASCSKARQEMLQSAGLNFDSVPADIDEEAITQTMLQDGKGAEEIAAELARQKAQQISGSHPGALVIGSDQVLDLDGELFSKAASEEEAKEKLKKLRGKTHQLISAVCVCRDNKILWQETGSAALTMKDFDDDFLEEYCSKAGEALTNCVGAYEIENEGAALFSDVNGDTDTIMGLPLSKLLAYLNNEHEAGP